MLDGLVELQMTVVQVRARPMKRTTGRTHALARVMSEAGVACPIALC